MKRVIISGGGTGGHIYPALTIANEITRLVEADILYVGSKNGLESELVPRHGYNFKTLEVRSLARRLTYKNLIALYKSSTAVLEACNIIRKFKPDVVIGTGGYVCGPILLAAAMMNVPTLIQEQNVVAGITNKILSRFVDVVAVGYEEAIKSFSHAKRVEFTGNPVRNEMNLITRETARQHFRIAPEQFMVLITGGSRGARSINNAMIGVHKHFAYNPHIKLFHVTGTGEYQRVAEALGFVDADKKGIDYGMGSRIVPYLHDMSTGLSAADMAVFRAGAVGLAELTVKGVPAILIPYPYASEDHQTYNAQALVKAGAAKMIVDSLLTDKDLIAEIETLYKNEELRKAMGESSLKLARSEAATNIAKLALSIAR